MIIILKDNANKEQLDNLTAWIKSMGIRTHLSEGENTTILGLIGDTSKLDIGLIQSLDIVHSVKRITEPFKNANRKFHPDDTIVNVSGVKFGGSNKQFIAGPCSVESEEQIMTIAREVKKAGASMLRGGAFKPRTSPYAFQGMRGEGIRLLQQARKETGLPIVTEIMDAQHLDLFKDVDMIQVGARNMQNFELLKELSKLKTPILLKRGLANTMQEWLMSAEYILAGGNTNVVLCERGIRTFETYSRNTLDISAVPIIRELSHLPIIVDPSHAVGYSRYVKPLSLASLAAGAHGLIVEVHNDPQHAMCDGDQSLTPTAFADLVTAGKKILKALE